MTSEIFENWLIALDKHFLKKRRTILMFLDNCSAHKIPNLTNIKVIFFPPNMTSHVQPMDMGIIKNLKHFYRKRVVVNLLAAANSEKKIDLLVASRMLKAAWEEVTQLTIRNCFAKAGFFSSEEPEIEILEIPEGWSNVSNGVSYEEFVNVDGNLSPFGHRSDDEIVSSLLHKKARTEESSDDEDESEIVEEKLPTCQEAINHLEKTNKFIEAQEDVPDSIFAASQLLESFLLQSQIKNRQQTKITDFFQK